MIEPPPDNPYKALGVSEDATDTAIRTAYRKLVLKSHPDKCQDESLKAQRADEFHKIQQAWELLSDEKRKQEYHDLVRLAKLRAELARDAPGPGVGLRRAATESFMPRSTPATPMYEDRGHVRYEERVPRSARAFPEDDRAPPPTPRFEERRPQPRRYEDPYEAAPPLSSRKASHGHTYSDDRRHSATDHRYPDPEDRERRARKEEKAAAQSRHANSKKARDKTRRQEYESKRSYNHAAVEGTETDSSSDRYARRSPADPMGRKRVDERHRGARPEATRHARVDDDTDSAPEPDSHRVTQYRVRADEDRVRAAEDYINKRGGKVTVPEPRASGKGETKARPAFVKSYTTVAPREASPPIDTPRRSSAARRTPTTPKAAPRERERDRGDRDRRMPEIVEARRDRDRDYDAGESHSHRGRPHLQPATSSPASIKVPHAATFDAPHRSKDKVPPSPLRRAATSPLNHMVSPTNAPPKSSKLRTTYENPSDSGYSSPPTPTHEIHPRSGGGGTARYGGKSPGYFSDEEGDEVLRASARRPATSGPSPRIIAVEPPADRDRSHRSHLRDRERDLSPRGTARGVRSPVRSPGAAGAAAASSSPRPSPHTTGSSKDGGYLFGEVRYADKIDPRSVRYANVARRGSGDTSSGRERDRDAYAYEGRDGGRREREGRRYAQGAY